MNKILQIKKVIFSCLKYVLNYKHKELIYSFPLNILILTNTSINFGNFGPA